MKMLNLLIVTLFFCFCFSNVYAFHNQKSSTNKLKFRQCDFDTTTSLQSRLMPLQSSVDSTSSSSSGGNFLTNLIKGDNMFRCHSAGAAFFGLGLLFGSDAILRNALSDELAISVGSFAYQQWAVFILAVSFITFNAPNLDNKSKELLSRTYGIMCLGETILYIKDIIAHFNSFNLYVYVVDSVTLAVFAFLAYGYFQSGLMGKLDMFKAK